jgi:hypothetical protein
MGAFLFAEFKLYYFEGLNLTTANSIYTDVLGSFVVGCLWNVGRRDAAVEPTGTHSRRFQKQPATKGPGARQIIQIQLVLLEDQRRKE